MKPETRGPNIDDIDAIILVVEGCGFMGDKVTATGDSWLMIDKQCVCRGDMTLIIAQPCSEKKGETRL